MTEPNNNVGSTEPPGSSTHVDLEDPTASTPSATAEEHAEPAPAPASSQYLWPNPYNNPDYVPPPAPVPAPEPAPSSDTKQSPTSLEPSTVESSDAAPPKVDVNALLQQVVASDDESMAEDEENILTEAEKAELANAVVPASLLPLKPISNDEGELEITFDKAEQDKAADIEQNRVTEQAPAAADRGNDGPRSYMGYVFVFLLTCAVIGLGIFAAVGYDGSDSSANVAPPLDNATIVPTASPVDVPTLAPSTVVVTEAPTPTFSNPSPIWAPTASGGIPDSPIAAPSTPMPTSLTATPSISTAPTMVTATTQPSEAASTVQPSTPSFSPTILPSLPPAAFACQDDKKAKIFVNDAFGDHDCQWLSGHPGHAARLCRDDVGGRARLVCRQLCGTCNV